MIRAILCPLLCLASVASATSILSAQQGASQGTPSGALQGTLQGTVRAAPTDVPLPYAVITIPALSIERFSGANGQFLIGNIAAGTHEVIVRRLGFVPERRTVTILPAQSTTLDVRLAQVPVRLSQMTVRPAEPCRNPGIPDSAQFPEVAQLVGLLRENADRYRLLVKQYPFTFVRTRALGVLRDQEFVIQEVESMQGTGVPQGDYQPGRVVKSERRPGGTDYSMSLPSLLDLADEAFAKNHCFRYAGASVHEDETWFRLDVRAADRLSSPDVHGAFYLDSATAQLRRMEVEMSRPDRLPRSLRSIRGVQVTTRFLEIAPGVSLVDNVCAVSWLKGSGSNLRHPIELQQIVRYAFSAPPPDIEAAGSRPAPPWNGVATLPRAELSCVAPDGL